MVGTVFRICRRRFQSVQQWHGDIHDDHVGWSLARHLDGDATVFSFANHFDIFFRTKECFETLSNDGVIIHQ